MFDLDAYLDRIGTGPNPTLRTVWSGLPASHRRALTAVAENTDALYAAARRHGGSRGGAIHTAVKALVNRGEIAGDHGARTGFRLTDPLLAAWIADNSSSTGNIKPGA